MNGISCSISSQYLWNIVRIEIQLHSVDSHTFCCRSVTRSWTVQQRGNTQLVGNLRLFPVLIVIIAFQNTDCLLHSKIRTSILVVLYIHTSTFMNILNNIRVVYQECGHFILCKIIVIQLNSHTCITKWNAVWLNRIVIFRRIQTMYVVLCTSKIC